MLVLLGFFGCAPSTWGEHPVYIADGDTGSGEPEEHDPLAWIEDRWTPTTAACAPVLYFEHANGEETSFDDEDCRAAMMADLDVVEASFAGEEGEGTLKSLLYGTYALLGLPTGSVEDLRLPPDVDSAWAVRTPFIEAIEAVEGRQGHGEVRANLYDLVTSMIDRTMYGREYETDDEFVLVASVDGRELTAYDTCCYGSSAILVHEAAHIWLDRGHVECPEGWESFTADYSGKKFCDADWAGAWGFSAAASRLLYDHIPDDVSGEGVDVFRWGARSSVSESAFHIIDKETPPPLKLKKRPDDQAR